MSVKKRQSRHHILEDSSAVVITTVITISTLKITISRIEEGVALRQPLTISKSGISRKNRLKFCGLPSYKDLIKLKNIVQLRSKPLVRDLVTSSVCRPATLVLDWISSNRVNNHDISNRIDVREEVEDHQVSKDCSSDF